MDRVDRHAVLVTIRLLVAAPGGALFGLAMDSLLRQRDVAMPSVSGPVASGLLWSLVFVTFAGLTSMEALTGAGKAIALAMGCAAGALAGAITGASLYPALRMSLANHAEMFHEKVHVLYEIEGVLLGAPLGALTGALVTATLARRLLRG